MYLPEQIDRDKYSLTLPAFSIVSATRKPAATLDISIMPMDFSFIRVENSGLAGSIPLNDDVLRGDFRDDSGQRSVYAGAQRLLGDFGDLLASRDAVAGFHDSD